MQNMRVILFFFFGIRERKMLFGLLSDSRGEPMIMKMRVSEGKRGGTEAMDGCSIGETQSVTD